MLSRRLLISAFTACLGTSAISQNIEPRPELQISEETTFFTEPVNADGTIDYIAVLNQKASLGITNRDNAFVVIAQLVPRRDDPYLEEIGYLPKLFEALGLEPNADRTRLVDWEAFAANHGIDSDDATEIEVQALSRPWSAEEFPVLHQWLMASQDAIALLSQAASRPAYYSPLVRTEDELILGVLLPHLGPIRDMARLIEIQVMHDLENNDHEEAIKNLVTIHVLGKLISLEQTTIGSLVGISFQNQQLDAITSLASQGELKHEVAKNWVARRSAVPPIETIDHAIGFAERCSALDLITACYYGKEAEWNWLNDFEGQKADNLNRNLSRLAQHPAFDINICLRMVNANVDRLVDIAQLPDAIERQEAFQQYDEALRRSINKDQIQEVIQIGLSGSLPRNGGWNSVLYTGTATRVYMRMLLPALGAAARTQQRTNARRLVESTAIALLGYRDQHGVLPESLDALVPEYFDAVPIDFATGEALIYRLHEEGSAVVYSIGDNFQDDGGIDDYAEGDIAIRIGPAPE